MRVLSKRAVYPTRRYTPEQKKAVALKKLLRERMLRDFYKMAGYNTRGEARGGGWTSGAGGLSPLYVHPVMDPDYEPPEGPARLTKRELKELL